MTNTQNTSERITSAADLIAAYAAGRRDFREADLSEANLRAANLGRAIGLTLDQLRAANTTAIRDDLYGYLEHMPHEVAGLLATLRDGRINGSSYDGPCACLAGTCERLAVRDGDLRRLELLPELRDLRDSSSPRERAFLPIRTGDTPENHPMAALIAGWLETWLVERPAIERGEESER